MGGSQTTGTEDCETSDSHDNPDLEFDTSGNCSNHCKLKSGKSNSIEVSLTIENNSYFTCYFDADVSSPGATQFMNVSLPNCDNIDDNESNTYTWDIYRTSGNKGSTDTLNVEVDFAMRDIYCPGRTDNGGSLNPEFTFD